MKTDNALHALLGPGSHRSQARPGTPQDAGGDPFAQMLADLTAQDTQDDARDLPVKGDLRAALREPAESDDAARLSATLAEESTDPLGERDDSTGVLPQQDDQTAKPWAGSDLVSGMAMVAPNLQTDALASSETPGRRAPRIQTDDSARASEVSQDPLRLTSEGSSAQPFGRKPMAETTPNLTPAVPVRGDGAATLTTELGASPSAETTLAGAKPTDKPAEKTTGPAPTASQTAPATPPGEWISTLARSKARPSAAGTRAGGEGLDDVSRLREAGDRRHARLSPEMRGSVEPAMTAALAATGSGASPDSQLGGSREDARAADTRTGGTQGGSGAYGDLSNPGQPSAADGVDFGLHLGQALGETFEAIGAQISLWAAGKSQRASFSVEDGLDDPLAVELTMTDGVAQVAFRTDDSAMRQLIQAQAPSALAEALTRAGLTLGGFSVGSQGSQGNPQQGHAPGEGRATVARMALTPSADRADATGLARVRSGHSTGTAGLDVYA